MADKEKDDIADFFAKLFGVKKSSQKAETLKTEVFAPTVRSPPYFNARQDCEALKNAMKGLGTNEHGLITVLCRRTWQQRAEIKQTYREIYNQDLEAEIDDETSGSFRKVLLRLLKNPVELLAFELHESMHGLGTDEEGLVEIICTTTNAELKAIKQKYQEMRTKSLEDAVAKDTGGQFNNLLMKLLAAKRSEMVQVHLPTAAADAKTLYEAGEKRSTPDYDVFIDIMTSCSMAHLRAVFEAYKREYKNDLAAVIRAGFSGDAVDGLLAIIVSILNEQGYFAERLHTALAGSGTCDAVLTRIISWRCDIDLEAIKSEYQRLYARSLTTDVSEKCDGDYRQALLVLLGEQ